MKTFTAATALMGMMVLMMLSIGVSTISASDVSNLETRRTHSRHHVLHHRKHRKIVHRKKKSPPKVRKPSKASRKPVPKPMSVHDPTITGWFSNLDVNTVNQGSFTPLSGVGSAPRYIAYGNAHVDNNTIGTPDPRSSIKGLTHYNLAFWESDGGNATTAGNVTTGSGNAQEWAQGPSALKKAIIREYNRNGVRLGVSLFGAFDTPQSSGYDPTKLAQTVAAFVKTNYLQGVDVDYEEYDLLTDGSGKGATWLIAFTKALRAALPRPTYYISHAPVAPLFNADQFPNGYNLIVQQVGDLIDFYNVQFYNQNGAYSNCTTLLSQSDVFKQTSLFELANVWKLPLQKIIIGKPAHPIDADTIAMDEGPPSTDNSPDGYITPQVEAQCLRTARSKKWDAGVMWWEYRGYIQDVLKPAKAAIGS